MANKKNKKKAFPSKNGLRLTRKNKGYRVEDGPFHPDGRLTVKISEIDGVYGISTIPADCFQRIGITNASLDTEVTVPQVRQAYARHERMMANARWKEAKKKRKEKSNQTTDLYPGNVYSTRCGTYDRSDMDDVADFMQNLRLHESEWADGAFGPGRALVHWDSDDDCTPSLVLLRAPF
ncbi:hypothetical protein EV715DRAFT_277578 [Schizophyllum commune]